MSAKTNKESKVTTLDGQKAKELIECLEADVKICIDTICASTVMPANVFDMFDDESWDVIAEALADLKAYIVLSNSKLRLSDARKKFTQRRIDSTAKGIQYWINKHKEDTTRLNDSLGSWVIKYNELLRETGGAA